jgi:hypothetical protein
MPYPEPKRVRRRCIGTLVVNSNLRQDGPDCLSSAAFTTSNSFAGRPQCFPRRCASFMPTTTLSLINSCSNSDIAPRPNKTSPKSIPIDMSIIQQSDLLYNIKPKSFIILTTTANASGSVVGSKNSAFYSGSGPSTAVNAPASAGSYQVVGSTLSLKIPDGRI